MTPRMFPIRLDPIVKSIPWVTIEPHRQQALMNHGQTLESLVARGGLSISEALAVIENRPWERMADTPARSRLMDYVAGVGRREPPALKCGKCGAVMTEAVCGCSSASDTGDDLTTAIALVEAMRDGKQILTRYNLNRLVVILERVKSRTAG